MNYVDTDFVNQEIDALRVSSIEIILESQTPSGAYIASPNFSVYNYCWFRDSSFIADAMASCNQVDSAFRFHNWATTVINARGPKIKDLIARKHQGIPIHPEEHLHCRFTIDGKESEEEWTNFQLDGFGTWLWSLDEVLRKGYPVSKSTLAAVTLLIPYLCAFWEEPSFDWWEESFGYQHVSTLVAIATGLERCADWLSLSEAVRDDALETSAAIRAIILERGLYQGRLTKWIGSSDLDGSLSSCVSPFHFFEPGSAIAEATLKGISSELQTFGTYRHKGDIYYGGGSWVILSAFLGLGYAESGDLERAREILTWMTEIANEKNELPEQLNDHLLFPAFENEWIEKWGVPAVPLLWSHAMYLKLLATFERLGGQANVKT